MIQATRASRFQPAPCGLRCEIYMYMFVWPVRLPRSRSPARCRDAQARPFGDAFILCAIAMAWPVLRHSSRRLHHPPRPPRIVAHFSFGFFLVLRHHHRSLYYNCSLFFAHFAACVVCLNSIVFLRTKQRIPANNNTVSIRSRLSGASTTGRR